MTALIIGFIGLVIVPAFILAQILNWVNKEPAESAANMENVTFVLTAERRRSRMDSVQRP